jgi:spore maturation protein CgeB
LVIAGKEWDTYNGPLDKYITQKTLVSDEQSLALYKQAKVGLNLSHSDPKSDSENTYVSKRVYDILLSNTLLITEDVPLAGEALSGVHYFSFGNGEALIHQVDEILNDYQNQMKKCAGNQKQILSEHTFKQRAMQILELTRK